MPPSPPLPATCSSPSSNGPTAHLRTQLYIDLDGTLADFDARFELISGHTTAEVKTKELWGRIAKDTHFFASLEWMPEAQRLWQTAVRLAEHGLAEHELELELRQQSARAYGCGLRG